ncbi:CBASS cGAMP-activated phospholipase [Ahrensia kielensis]|uniref:CBASS cGAMP-activated phospholipase n=1 Tax=Ahrensia kielensis TaxID=76980 RepID=UPI003CCC49EE
MDLNQSPKLGHPPFTNRRANSRLIPRKRLKWPRNKPFRILSLDGGGIRGLYSAKLLELIEEEITGGVSVADFFDLLAGTSTGGIIAVGLGFGKSAAQLTKLYNEGGQKIFPPEIYACTKRPLHNYGRNLHAPKYDHGPLEALLFKELGDGLLGQSKSRLVIPSFMVPTSEVAVFKTDHHPDYIRDHKMAAWEVCRATSAAPTFFAPHERNGRGFIDGGLWANNPVMVAVTEALSSFDITPDQLMILSIGTGNEPYEISLKQARGGLWHWKGAVSGAMSLATDNASAQVGLMIGADRIFRIEPESQIASIEMDDWEEAVRHLPDAARTSLSEGKDRIRDFFVEKTAAREHFYTNNAS